MLVEKSVKEALADYLEGRKVIIISELEEGSIALTRLEEILPLSGRRWLVDVPVDVPVMPNPAGFCEAPADSAKDGSGHTEKPMQQNLLRKGKTKCEIISELKEQGLTMREIADKTGFTYATVYYHYNGQKKKTVASESEEEKAEPGHNADRHLCKTCQYRTGLYGKSRGGMNCNYIGVEGHSRGCKVEECNVYKPRVPQK